MSTKTGLPFFKATHHLTATTRDGTLTAEVMAVADPKNKATRLYFEKEISSPVAPLWRVVGQIPESEMVLSDLNPIQRDRKTNRTAALKRISEIMWFEHFSDGEFAAIRTEVKTIPQPVVVHDPTPEIERPSFVDVEIEPSDGDDIDQEVDDAIVRALNAEDAKVGPTPEEKKIVDEMVVVDSITEDAKAAVAAVLANDPPAAPAAKKRPRVIGGKKKASKKATRTGHRPGSIMGMDIAGLRAEWKRLTTTEAPSNSLHYMRKMVMGARRGQTSVLNRKPRKAPVLTLTLDQVKAIVGDDPAAAKIVGTYVRTWYETHVKSEAKAA